MFWSFQNPIRSIRRLSERAEYTLLPNHYTRRGSAQSQSSIDTEGASEKGDEGNEDINGKGTDRRLKRGRMLVIFLLFLLGGVGMYHHFQSTSLSLGGGLDEPTLEVGVGNGMAEEVEVYEEEGITREVYYNKEDPTHVYLSPLWPLPHSRQLLLRPPVNEVLIRYIETGEITPSIRYINNNIGSDSNSDTDPDTDSSADLESDTGATVDIVYLWVNSTDPNFSPAYHARMSEEELPVDEGQARRWRDNGELKGAVRSSVESLGEGLRRVHIVSGDYNPESESGTGTETETTPRKRDHRQEPRQSQDEGMEMENNGNEAELEQGWEESGTGTGTGTGTVGQIPEWLDWSAQQDGTSEKVTWHFHSDIFRLPRDHRGRLMVDEEVLGAYELVSPGPSSLEDENSTDKSQNDNDNETEVGTGTPGSLNGPDGDLDQEMRTENRLEEAWRDLALPTFNSFAIESRVGWITGLSDNFILSNDDMFFLEPMSPLDFHRPLLGPVLRLATQLTVPPHLPTSMRSSPGEWGGLQHASLLLSKRFTLRSQPYPEHFPKSLTLSMMDEASIMFSTELGLASTRGFRESKRGKGDVEMAALASWLRVERWREALLWTWVVGKQGPIWGLEARKELEGLFGDELAEGKTVLFRKRRRTTLDDITQEGEQPMNTRYKFSSLDGHLPRNVDHPARQCFFAPYCLPDQFFSDPESTYPSEEVFKRIAFERPQCGDCLIEALVSASGELGLEAFLPNPEAVYIPSSTFDYQNQSQSVRADSGPILPLTNDWRTTNFTLDSVLTSSSSAEKVNLRRWCLELLSRYVYTIGATPAVFAPVASARQLASKLRQVGPDSGVAMLCVNDDVDEEGGKGNPNEAGLFKYVLGRWMDSEWPDMGEWERGQERNLT